MNSPTHRLLTALCGLLVASSLQAASFVVELPVGNSLTAGVKVEFGGRASRYLDPASAIQQPDGTHRVAFAGVPVNSLSSYEIQRSSDGENNWTGLFVPDLEPTSGGAIAFHDQQPVVTAFYRLFISTDTSRQFIIRNSGATSLTDITVVLTGEDSANFELDTLSTDTELAPASTTTFTVTYLADDDDIRTASLSVSANAEPPFLLQVSGGIAPVPALIAITHTLADATTPAAIAGTIVNGPLLGSLFLEASTDLGVTDPWTTIATITLDGNGGAVFGTPTPVTDPGSTGASGNFYRLRGD